MVYFVSNYYIPYFSVRQYSLTTHDDIPKDKIYTGEIARLGSFTNQKL